MYREGALMGLYLSLLLQEFQQALQQGMPPLFTGTSVLRKCTPGIWRQ